jgi:hypothetical protein
MALQVALVEQERVLPIPAPVVRLGSREQRVAAVVRSGNARGEPFQSGRFHGWLHTYFGTACLPFPSA